MRAYIRRKVSTYSRTHKKREKIKFFFVRFKENLKCDWHRHRHIPSMEYFMQNANKTFQTNTHARKNTTWVLLIQSAIIRCVLRSFFNLRHCACIDRCTAAVWLLMTFYCGFKAIQTLTMGHLALFTFTDTQSFQVNYLMLESQFCDRWQTLEFEKPTLSMAKDHSANEMNKWTAIDLIWKVMASPGVNDRMWPPMYVLIHDQIDFCTLMLHFMAEFMRDTYTQRSMHFCYVLKVSVNHGASEQVIG